MNPVWPMPLPSSRISGCQGMDYELARVAGKRESANRVEGPDPFQAAPGRTGIPPCFSSLSRNFPTSAREGRPFSSPPPEPP